MEAAAKDAATRCDLPTLLRGRWRETLDPWKGGAMASGAVRALEGQWVCVALRGGDRIDDCQLVSAGRASTGTLWVFSNGADLFLPVDDVIAVWEAPAGRAA